MKAKSLTLMVALVVLSLLVAQCGPSAEPEVIIQTVEVEKTIVETVEVEKTIVETVEVEKTIVETVEVEKTVVEEVEVTAVPAPEGPTGTLVRAVSTFPNSLDLPQAAERQASTTAWQMYDSLVWFDDDGVIVPALAESWEVSEDNTEYTFHLRQDVTFHNGEPFNADAVVFSWERAKDAGFEYSYHWETATSVEKIDD